MSETNRTQMPYDPNSIINYAGLKLRELYLAGGCFWGEEAFIRRTVGVADTECGYANGTKEHPTYEEVCAGDTGHAETVRVRFAPALTTVSNILDAYFETIDPEAKAIPGGQYRNGIYYTDGETEKEIEAYLKEKKAAGAALGMEVVPLSVFWEAEDYHQDYLEKNPGGFCHVDLSKLEY